MKNKIESGALHIVAILSLAFIAGIFVIVMAAWNHMIAIERRIDSQAKQIDILQAQIKIVNMKLGL